MLVLHVVKRLDRLHQRIRAQGGHADTAVVNQMSDLPQEFCGWLLFARHNRPPHQWLPGVDPS
jgi:hypothetical protein